MKDYIKQTLRTECDYIGTKELLDEKGLRLLHSILGMCTEAGEAADIIKRHLFYKCKLDDKHLIEELGDLAWYVALICFELGIDFEEVQKRNIEKLKVRYPEKFDAKKAVNRDLEAEMKALCK